MNYLQTELILLNLLRQSAEFVVSLLGIMPEPDAGSFYKRLLTLYEIFKTDKTGFAASSFRLGQVALLLKEYAALTKQHIDQVDLPEILSPAISWEDIADKPEFFAPYSHFHKWEEIANKPVKYLPVTHQHTWSEVTEKPTTFPPADHTHAAQALAWADVADKPTTYPPADHTHPEYAGGGGTSVVAAASAWALRLNGAALTYVLPPDIWSGARLRMLVSGIIRQTDDGCTILYLYDGGSVSASLVTDAGNQVTGYLAPVSVSVANAERSMTAILDITPTAMAVTVNGVTASDAITRPATTQTALYMKIPGWETITRVGVWTGDPATTAPLILAGADRIENNVLINQAARQISAGQYDLTLDAPVILYQ